MLIPLWPKYNMSCWCWLCRNEVKTAGAGLQGVKDIDMITVDFLGQKTVLDENLLYYQPSDYWVRPEKEGLVVFGLTPAGIIKEGGYRSIEFTVNEGDAVRPGDVIAVAVTGKIKYLETIAGGVILDVNRRLAEQLSLCNTADLNHLWLVRLQKQNDMAANLVTYQEYGKALKQLNRGVPPGAKGPGSPTCKSVYEAIKEQAK